MLLFKRISSQPPRWIPKLAYPHAQITTGRDVQTAEGDFAVYGCHDSDGRALIAL
jgi:hypothetical protein